MLTFPILPMTGPVVLEALRGFSGSTCSPTTTPRDLGTRPPRAGGRAPEVESREDFNPGAILDGVS